MDEAEENNMIQDEEVVELDHDDNNEDNDDDDDGNVNMMVEEEDDDEGFYVLDEKEINNMMNDQQEEEKDDDDDDDDEYTMVEEEHDDDDDDDDDDEYEEEEDDDDVYVDDEIDVKMYIQPGNPQFFAKHNRQRPNELHIPAKVIKDFSLCFKKHIILICCNCKDVQRNEIAAYHHILPQMSKKHIQKRGEISTWRDGRMTVKAWEDFCKKSKITENDGCLCEIVLREDGTIEMLKVHVVRKNCAA
ncbi:plant-specific B3-DNA-binding domain protein [Trifolium pratense]|uniref:Plant-specific B3-DNA-binding domain protein n=1 Tax=Trifolium pratense TaxID=57577 RepID=A0A2K3LBT9_TRIPR|nr:plant-specific B3-DNA-binding domain protein [Trifolium pratense]